MIQPRILMCQPDFYGIEYEINAWMHRDRPADRALARVQWQALKRAIEEVGAAVDTLPAVAGLPDLVFTANAAVVYRDLAIVAHFRHSERQGEEAYDDRWLAEHGFHVEHLPPETYFEGAGDALFCGETLFGGYRLRSEFRRMIGLANASAVGSSRWNWLTLITTTWIRAFARSPPARRFIIRTHSINTLPPCCATWCPI